MSKKILCLAIFALALIGTAGTAGAAPLSLGDVPDPLKSWVPWVLDDDEAAGCPHPFASEQMRHCAWPGALEMKAGADGASFTQDWQVYRETWVALPGDAQQWPQAVSVDGRQAVVLSRAGVPSLKLPPGAHRLAGGFSWRQLPESLALPEDLGLIRLELGGRPVAQAVRDENNRLWLQRKVVDADSAEQAQVRVHRKVFDGIPLRVETRIRIEVSGRNREISIGRALLPEFVPQALASPLPAALSQDGSLKVQARAGTWDLVFVARHPANPAALSLPEAGGLLAAQEVWVFASAPLLRTVSVEGPPAVDPQQTTLPRDWQGLPAYLMQAASRFGLKEARRGDSEAPDRLSLERRLWLGFDGSLLTVRDRIQGEVGAATRLTLGGGARLGRVDVQGQDQLITQGEDGQPGIEVKRGRLALTADSLLPGAPRDLPAAGWLHDFDRISLTLALPAGWRLLHAGGADRADGAWLSRWNLLDFFLAIVVALAVGHLWGRRWGAVALALLVLSYHEPGAPRYVWLVLLAAAALARALPPGRFKIWLTRAERGSLLALLLISLAFATTQVRGALYPVLERADSAGFTDSPDSARFDAPAPFVPQREAAPSEGGLAAPAPVAEPKVPKIAETPLSSARAKVAADARRYVQSVDPNARVQTGPGLPDWRWHEYRLSWSGPVRQDQRLDLWLLSPWGGKVAVVLRLLLLALLLARIAGLPLRRSGSPGGGAGRALPGGLAAAVALFLLLPAGPAEAQMPSDSLLDQLKEKLTRPADCLPECAELTRLSVQAAGTALRLGLEVDAAIDTALPLPGGEKHWLPRVARLDGKVAHIRRDEQGALWLLTPAGRHRVELEGDLPARDTVQLPLPRKPRRVEVNAADWDVAGISEEAGAADTLQLTRRRKAQGNGEAPALPPFLRVERRLLLDLVWRVETTVRRESPRGVPALAEIPLLPGEAVASAGIDVKDGKVLLNLGAQADELSWSSTLEQRPEIVLAAAKTSAWAETWIVAASTVWHLTPSGIPPVPDETGQGADLAFRPWPGETLKIGVARPQAVGGQTLTIDSSTLTVTPGMRAADYRLSLVLRSSRGSDHSVTLPEGASLQQVLIDGQARPIRASGRQLALPVVPGRQNIELAWRVDRSMAASYATLPVDLGLPSVNSHLRLHKPQDRWLLAAGGPGLGPAILYWGVLLVMLAAALALGRVPGLPLRTRQWVLLALGLTQIAWWAAACVAGWFFVLAARGRSDPAGLPRWLFNLRQIALLVLTLLALGILFDAVHGGLLGQPEMQVAGNQSSAELLHWYVDRSEAQLPVAWMLTLPMLAYRGLMLAWALWLAWALLGWLKWGWGAFGHGGLWRGKLKDSLSGEIGEGGGEDGGAK